MATKRLQEISLTNFTDQENLLLKGVNLNDITIVLGTLWGTWISEDGIPAEFCQLHRKKSSICVQLKMYADRYCKGVQLCMIQKGDDIYGKIDWAKGTKRRSERTEKIENLLLHDWNDLSNPDVANLDSSIPIGKDGYGIAKIVVELATHALFPTVSKPVEQPKENIAEVKHEEKEVTLQKEDKKPLFTTTPIPQQPITLERIVKKDLKITCSKTYDHLAIAPIQGIDIAGRRTFEIDMDELPNLKSAKNIELKTNTSPTNLMNIINAIPTNKSLDYENMFWIYLKAHVDKESIKMTKGHVLGSSFGLFRTQINMAGHIRGDMDNANLPITTDLDDFMFNIKYSINHLDRINKDLRIRNTDKETIVFSEDPGEFESIIMDMDTHKKIFVMPTPVSFDFNNTCEKCFGEGTVRCSECDGSGRERYIDGYYANGEERIKTGPCHHCHGKGYYKCNKCESTGKKDKGTGKLVCNISDFDIRCSLLQVNSISSSFFDLSESDYSYNTVDPKDLNKYESYKNQEKNKQGRRKVGYNEIEKLNDKYLYQPNQLEVLFNTENENSLALDNHHKQVSDIINNIGKNEFDYLYYRNLKQAVDAFKLKEASERIVAIFEKHNILDTFYKLDIPIDFAKIFTVYLSINKNQLYYFGELPQLPCIKDFQEEEKKFAEKKRKKEEHLKEEKRQATYSQSMDTLLDKSKTTKTGMFSRLFRTDEYKQHKDAEKAIKLMIYIAKADGTLDVDEKEFLTKKITKDLNEGYTDESRKNFLTLLNSEKLPELTTEDCRFRSKDVAKRVLENLVKLAKANGIVAKEEQSLLVIIATEMNLKSYLEKLM